MFGMIGGIRNLCWRVIAVRHLTTSTFDSLPYTPRDNPGVYRRLKVISKDEPDIDGANIDYDSIDALEQDFMQSGEMHEEITREMEHISKRQQYKITERKHFKPPKEPGMLTWSEKEQIRHLNREDPEKWTPEALSRSFPASPAIIKKVLKANWKPLDAEKLKAHDIRVSENWVAFHKGQLEVHDHQLRTHLSRFVDRKDGVRIVSDEEAAKITEVILPKPKNSEFLSLITSFNSESKSAQSKMDVNLLEERLETNKQPFEMDQLHSGTNYTLQQFRRRLEEEAENLSETPEEIKPIIGRTKSDVSENKNSTTMYVAPSESFKVNAVAYKKSSKSPLSLIDIDDLPNKISIPKEQWKQGKVYRVNDCFYNDKGNFLYRVPGLKA
ncbi:hypothetical protein J6590_082279 [Homalodisca vitripennis]|nr:hypothetical protein J6590_082279 [Homalodisca vitripennis]